MKAFHVGQMIKNRRIQLGLTQEELCEGICEPATLSRIESGRNDPSRSRLTVLLQRLGLPENRYFALLSEKDIAISNLQTEIVSLNVHEHFLEALEKLDELEDLIHPDDLILKQFILRSRAVAGKIENNQAIPYDFQSAQDLLLDAIRLTVPRFDLEGIEQHHYGLDEMKIINQIALNYSNHGLYDKAIPVYYQLMRYVRKHMLNLEIFSSSVVAISYNYSRILCIEKRPKEALEIAQLGWDYAVRYGKTSMLGDILFMVAESLRQLGETETCKAYFSHSYHVYCSLKNETNAQIVAQHVKEELHCEID